MFNLEFFKFITFYKAIQNVIEMYKTKLPKTHPWVVLVKRNKK